MKKKEKEMKMKNMKSVKKEVTGLKFDGINNRRKKGIDIGLVSYYVVAQL